MVYVLVVNGAVTAVYSNKNAVRSDKQQIEKKIQDLAIVGVPYRTKSVLN